MKNCTEFETSIDRLYDAQCSEQEQSLLMQHMDGCRPCTDYFDLIGRLSAEHLYPEPDPSDLLQMRRAVIRQLRHDKLERRAWSSWFFMPRHSFAQALLAVIGGVLLVALGFITGNNRVERNVIRDGNETALSRDIELVAMKHGDLADVENSPYRYSNVQIRETNDGRVQLSFDVARHMEIVTERNAPLVTEVLVQSLLDPSSIGNQLRAISHAGDHDDPRLREALVKAMLTDSNLAVRLEAQAKLVSHVNEREVQNALLTVLQQEENVQMRLVAIDYLTRQKVDPQLLEQAVEAGEPQGRSALYVKAGGYIRHF
jgi:hypothetical protein